MRVNLGVSIKLFIVIFVIVLIWVYFYYIFVCLFLEQMDIVKKREGKEDKLTWGEIQKMKYTWRVAQELMRTIPVAFGGFRKAMKDTSYGGYAIPKGWQVRS
jgi:cytochrome P450